MNTLVTVLLAASCTQSVFSSYLPHKEHITVYYGPLAAPVVLKSGYLADTQEVAAARSAHQAALEKQSHPDGYSEDQEYSRDRHNGLKYHGPTAVPHVLHDGHLADTHEVAAARTEHQAAVAKVKSLAGYHHVGDEGSVTAEDHGYDHHTVSYHGPLARPTVLKSGFLADTHEVAAAKEQHLQAFHKADQYQYKHN